MTRNWPESWFSRKGVGLGLRPLVGTPHQKAGMKKARSVVDGLGKVGRLRLLKQERKHE